MLEPTGQRASPTGQPAAPTRDLTGHLTEAAAPLLIKTRGMYSSGQTRPQQAPSVDKGDPGAVDQLIARVLRQAHHTAEVMHAPNEERAILHVAHLFADELTHANPQFDRLGFIRAATQGQS
jgi:hypothetical protein